MENGESFNVNLPDGRSYKFAVISLEKANNLIESQNGMLSDKYSKLITNGKPVFLLNDRSVIRFSFTDAYHFETEEGFMLSLEERLKAQKLNRKKIMTAFPKEREMPAADFRKIRYKELISDHPEGIVINSAVNDRNKRFLEPVINAGGKLILQDGFNYQAFQTKDGKVTIFYIRGKCREFQSREDFDAFFNTLARYSGKPERYYFLQGRNPFGADLLKQIDKLTAELSSLTGVPVQKLDFSLGSLTLIWKALKKQTFSDELVNKVYLPLLVYLGEAQIRNFGGKWDLFYDNYYRIWVPEVLSPAGRKTEIYLSLFEDLDPDKEKFQPFDALLKNDVILKPKP